MEEHNAGVVLEDIDLKTRLFKQTVYVNRYQSKDMILRSRKTSKILSVFIRNSKSVHVKTWRLDV